MQVLHRRVFGKSPPWRQGVLVELIAIKDFDARTSFPKGAWLQFFSIGLGGGLGGCKYGSTPIVSDATRVPYFFYLFITDYSDSWRTYIRINNYKILRDIIIS